MAMAMPLIGMGLSAAQGVSGGKGGKGARKLAQQQLDMQKANQQFGTGLVNTGMTDAWKPASGYWNTLLKGDPNAVAQAVGPYSDQIRNQAAAASGEMAARMPAGGEANAAMASNAVRASDQMARLFAGMQPSAAEHLGQLSTIPIGAGASIMSSSAPNVGAGLNYLTNANQTTGNTKASAGQGFGSSADKLNTQIKNRRAAGATPNYNPTNAFSPGFSQAPSDSYT